MFVMLVLSFMEHAVMPLLDIIIEFVAIIRMICISCSNVYFILWMFVIVL